jgi:hypothetical protein
METGIRVLLLTVALAALSGCASVRDWYHHRAEVRDANAAARDEAKRADQPPDDDANPRVVEPEVERRKITVPKIRSDERRARPRLRRPVDRGFRRESELRGDHRVSRHRRLLLSG